MRSFLKNVVFAGLAFVRPNLKNSASILMYHSVGKNDAFFTVKSQSFEKQLAYLKEKKFRVLKLSELIDRLEHGKDISNVACITFDDGYADNYEIALPLLKKYNMPASIFLSTGLVGKTFTNSQKILLPMLSLVQIKEMNESGLIEFLPHGEHHKKLHALSEDEATHEIQSSVKFIQEVCNTKPDILAYPSGFYNEYTIEILRKLGFRAAVTVQPGLVHSFEKPFELRRNPIDSTTSMVQFRGMVSSAIDMYVSLR